MTVAEFEDFVQYSVAAIVCIVSCSLSSEGKIIGYNPCCLVSLLDFNSWLFQAVVNKSAGYL